MKQISKQDIEQLRKQILERHDLLLQTHQTLKKVLPADSRQMILRLKAAQKEMDRLLAQPERAKAPVSSLQEAKLALHQELDELRLYFGVPTARPLESRGVEFVPLYIQALRMLFQLNPRLTLYYEMIRTDLALLEYRIEHRQKINSCLMSLMDSIVQYQHNNKFTDINSFSIHELGHYLFLICQTLAPLMKNQKDDALLQLICQTYLEIAIAFQSFNCAPENTVEQFYDFFLLSIITQITNKKPSKHIALQCCVTCRWLWNFPLLPEQKDQVAYLFRQAQEVLNHA